MEIIEDMEAFTLKLLREIFADIAEVNFFNFNQSIESGLCFEECQN